MDIHEFQAKEFLKKYGIPVQSYRLCSTADECVSAFRDFGEAVVIKAQVHTSGRAKAGGVKFAKSVEDVREAAEEILGMTINGLAVERVITCKAIDVVDEFYIGFIADRHTKSIVLIASAEGGIDIEEVALSSPEQIIKVPIDMEYGVWDFQARKIANRLFNDDKYMRQLVFILKALYRAFVENDFTLAEINPLIITNDGNLLALDAKITIDDNTLFRHPEFEGLRRPSAEEKTELYAKSRGLSFIKLEGEIGCMVNGAGLAMATMDLINHHGGKPANFLDIGGSSSPQKVIDAIDILSKDESIKVIVINIFGGITRCDDVADGLLQAIDKIDLDVPIVVRLTGTNAEKGRKMLENTTFISANTMAEAAQIAISLASKL